jgi:hypothetical protein
VAGPSGAGVFTGGELGFCISFPCKFILVLLQNKKDNLIIVGIFIFSRQIEVFHAICFRSIDGISRVTENIDFKVYIFLKLIVCSNVFTCT